MNKFLLPIILIASLVTLFLVSRPNKQEAPITLGSDFANPLVSQIGRYATSGPALINATVPIAVLATSTGPRLYAEICNTSNVGGAYLGLGFKPSNTQNATTGRYLAPRGCYEIAPGKNLFQGAVYAIASSTESNTVQLTVYEASR